MRQIRVPVLVAGIALTGGLLSVVPAAAGAPPTEVKIAWVDDTHQQLRVSWQDDGVGNLVRAFVQGDDGIPRDIRFVPAADPNELVFRHHANISDNKVVRVAVYAATDRWTTTSVPTYSEWFDSTGPARITIEAAAPRSDGRLQLGWRLTPRPDVLPGDVLDLPPAPDEVATEMAPASCCAAWQRFPVASTARSFVFPSRARPYRVMVDTQNEWGDDFNNEPIVHVGEHVVRAAVPTTSTYGRPLTITGTVTRVHPANDCGTPSCVERTPAVWARVLLQTRATSSSPWSGLGGVTADGAGRFRMTVVAPGSRQYRVVAPGPRPTVWDVVFSGASPAAANSTRYWVRQASFVDATASYGQRVTARLTVSPPVNVRTTLQRWTGSQWVSLKWVYLRNGSGSFTFTAAQRGRTAYRFIVPTSTYAGRPIATTATAGFVLVTR